MKSGFKTTKGNYRVTYAKGSSCYRTYMTDQTINNSGVSTTVWCDPADGKNVGDHVRPTNWHYTINSVQRFVGVRYVYCKSDKKLLATHMGTYGAEPLTVSAWERQDLWNTALQRLNDRVRTQADWAEDIAQAKSTSRSLGLAKLSRLTSDLVGLVKTLKTNPAALFRELPELRRHFPNKKVRRNFLRALRRETVTVSEGVLSYKYVYKPLLLNIFDTAEALLNLKNKGYVRVLGSATRTIDTSGRCTNGNSGDGRTDAVQYTNKGKQGCRFTIVMRGMDENRLADFTTLDPRVLAWNLLPFSFVVDWVYSIGGYLEAQEHALRFNPLFVTGWVEELYANYRVEEIIGGIHTNSTEIHDIAYGRARRRNITYKRTVLTGWPLPQRPVFTTDLGSSRLLAAAALLGVLLGRKSKRS